MSSKKMEEENRLIEQGVTTAPYMSKEEEIKELRLEVERLKRELAKNNIIITSKEGSIQPNVNEHFRVGQDGGPINTEIKYHKQPSSGARLIKITKRMLNEGKIRNTTEIPNLPKPTRDQTQLEYDFMRYGYCLIKDAMTPEQCQLQIDRIIDQGAAEHECGVAHMSHRGAGQTLFNLIPKGEVFRKLVELNPTHLNDDGLTEKLLKKILGRDYYLGTAHGSIVNKGGGLQDMHQDQGFVPLPHPNYPAACLIIWLYTDFSVENGGTYIVPGSHMDENGLNRVFPGTEFEQMAENNNLFALNAPAGTAFITDSRLLHSGGRRTADGTRYAARILYNRGFLRQQENQIAAVSDAVLDKCSDKLIRLMGYSGSAGGLGMVDGNNMDPFINSKKEGHYLVEELSMNNLPRNRNFSWKYTKNAKMMSRFDWAHAEYLGGGDDVSKL